MTFHCYITIPLIIGVIITVLLAFLNVEQANKKWEAEHAATAQKEANA